MSNNVTGSPGTIVPITGPGGRLPVGPLHGKVGGSPLMVETAGVAPFKSGSPPTVAGTTPIGGIPLTVNAVTAFDGNGPYPGNATSTSAPMNQAASFPG